MGGCQTIGDAYLEFLGNDRWLDYCQTVFRHRLTVDSIALRIFDQIGLCDSGMFSSDKRKSLLPKNLSASVVCAKNEKNCPVAPVDLKKAHYK